MFICSSICNFCLPLELHFASGHVVVFSRSTHLQIWVLLFASFAVSVPRFSFGLTHTRTHACTHAHIHRTQTCVDSVSADVQRPSFPWSLFSFAQHSRNWSIGISRSSSRVGWRMAVADIVNWRNAAPLPYPRPLCPGGSSEAVWRDSPVIMKYSSKKRESKQYGQ